MYSDEADPAKDTEYEERAIFLDPLSVYLHDITRHPVLSADEEKEITERIARYRDADAKDRLIVANLRLVVKVALQFPYQWPKLLDRIQEGNLGLLRAVEKFDPARGTRFATYASFWIRAYILRHIADDFSVVKIGTKDSERKLFYALGREKERLRRSGCEVSLDSVAERFSVKPEEVQQMEMRLQEPDVSLDDPVFDGGDPLIDILSTGEDVEATAAEREEHDIVNECVYSLIACLGEKERYILMNRIMADEPMTLEEIGVRLHLSRERVRQVQKIVSRKLSKRLMSRLTYAVRPSVFVGQARES